MSILHENNEPCPVIQAAEQYFGNIEDALNFLWGNTCFPMSDQVAMQQLQNYIDSHETKVT